MDRMMEERIYGLMDGAKMSAQHGRQMGDEKKRWPLELPVVSGTMCAGIVFADEFPS